MSDVNNKSEYEVKSEDCVLSDRDIQQRLSYKRLAAQRLVKSLASQLEVAKQAKQAYHDARDASDSFELAGDQLIEAQKTLASALAEQLTESLTLIDKLKVKQ